MLQRVSSFGIMLRLSWVIPRLKWIVCIQMQENMLIRKAGISTSGEYLAAKG